MNEWELYCIWHLEVHLTVPGIFFGCIVFFHKLALGVWTNSESRITMQSQDCEGDRQRYIERK